MVDLWESWRVCAAVGQAFEGCGGEGERIRARLLELLQAVPVESAEKAVRCCECRHLGFKDFYGVCTFPGGLPGKVQPGDYCSHAERDEPSGMTERAGTETRPCKETDGRNAGDGVPYAGEAETDDAGGKPPAHMGKAGTGGDGLPRRCAPRNDRKEAEAGERERRDRRLADAGFEI